MLKTVAPEPTIISDVEVTVVPAQIITLSPVDGVHPQEAEPQPSFDHVVPADQFPLATAYRVLAFILSGMSSKTSNNLN